MEFARLLKTVSSIAAAAKLLYKYYVKVIYLWWRSCGAEWWWLPRQRILDLSQGAPSPPMNHCQSTGNVRSYLPWSLPAGAFYSRNVVLVSQWTHSENLLIPLVVFTESISTRWGDLNKLRAKGSFCLTLCCPRQQTTPPPWLAPFEAASLWCGQSPLYENCGVSFRWLQCISRHPQHRIWRKRCPKRGK